MHFSIWKLREKGPAHLKESCEWYIAEVTNMEKPQKEAVRIAEAYKRMLPFFSTHDSTVGEEICKFYIDSRQIGLDYIAHYGEDNVARDLVEFSDVVLEMTANAMGGINGSCKIFLRRHRALYHAGHRIGNLFFRMFRGNTPREAQGNKTTIDRMSGKTENVSKR